MESVKRNESSYKQQELDQFYDLQTNAYIYIIFKIIF